MITWRISCFTHEQTIFSIFLLAGGFQKKKKTLGFYQSFSWCWHSLEEKLMYITQKDQVS